MMAASTVTTILLVDDHDLVRTGLRCMLGDILEFSVVGEASSGEDALILGRKLKPDVVLMDIRMPGIGGYEATRKLRLAEPTVKVLVVTTCDNDIYPARLLGVGASGYLTKNASMNEMIQAIKAVAGGQRYISPEIASRLALRHVADKVRSSSGCWPAEHRSHIQPTTRQLRKRSLVIHRMR